MKLNIQKDGQLVDIQNQFSEHFPYLRIDFYRFPHMDKKLSPKNESLDKYTPVSEVVKWNDDKIIEIDDQMTISQLESTMEQIGLFVQVFRKSGRVWIETSYTDDWSLQKQNEEGKMLGSIHDIDSEKQVDWDDWDE
jgi:hypothetical protein